MGNMHSAVRQKSYFYVFAHQTSSGDYPQVRVWVSMVIKMLLITFVGFGWFCLIQSWGSIHGEELPYVFGMPLVGGTNHLALNYTRAEMLLSEMIITYWTNFARTGSVQWMCLNSYNLYKSLHHTENIWIKWLIAIYGNPTSNPNFPPRQKFLSITPYDRFETTNIQWPTFDRHSQKYLNIGKI